MSDVLERICRDKKDHVARMKREVGLAVLDERIRGLPLPAGFAASLARRAASGLALIAEIKKASPSAGVIRRDFEPAALARAYRDAGAACLSVLTDTPWFQGRDEHLIAARQASGLPCLRKDFMIDPYQVVEARAMGADCILVILAAVGDGLAGELVSSAGDHGLDVLVEIHHEAELERALRLDAGLIGINNRNLKTLDVDLETTRHLAPRVPAERDVVCESGLRSHEDCVSMTHAGVRRFLAGEHLMRRQDVAAATREFLGQGKQS